MPIAYAARITRWHTITAMASLVLPDRVVLRLVDGKAQPIRQANVLFRIYTFARRKNDFSLGPFVTDADGIATFTKRELLAEAEAHYDSGLMDYVGIADCQPLVEIQAMSPQEIDQALKARTRVWKQLLRGERGRWKDIEELRDVYRAAANIRVSVKPVQVLWDGSQHEFEYTIPASIR